jgi:hypothetical protein
MLPGTWSVSTLAAASGKGFAHGVRNNLREVADKAADRRLQAADGRLQAI